jgi:succinate dehydrogenase / fumarate reductase membrane anchor subunit
MSLRTALGEVLGRGAAGAGVGHWWAQRVSAMMLVPLTVWFAVGLVRLPLNDYAAVSIWLGGGWNPLWLALLLLALCWHSRLGVQVVVEDYVHGPSVKLAALLCNSAAHLLLLASGLYALLRLAFRSAT